MNTTFLSKLADEYYKLAHRPSGMDAEDFASFAMLVEMAARENAFETLRDLGIKGYKDLHPDFCRLVRDSAYGILLAGQSDFADEYRADPTEKELKAVYADICARYK